MFSSLTRQIYTLFNICQIKNEKKFHNKAHFSYSSPCLGIVCSLFFAQKSRFGRLPSSFHDCTSSLSTKTAQLLWLCLAKSGKVSFLSGYNLFQHSFTWETNCFTYETNCFHCRNNLFHLFVLMRNKPEINLLAMFCKRICAFLCKKMYRRIVFWNLYTSMLRFDI